MYMARVLCFLFSLLTSTRRSRLSLQLEIAALCHQLSAYRVKGERPRIAPPDRPLWSLIADIWPQWRRVLFFVQPRTVTVWQRKRFRGYWRALSQHGRPGRPKIARELRQLIRRMWKANPTWGFTQGLSRNFISSVSKSQNQPWRSTNRAERDCRPQHGDRFLNSTSKNSSPSTSSSDRPPRSKCCSRSSCWRMIDGDVHFNVTEQPTAQWTAPQLVEAFPFDTAPRYLLRDGEGIYGERVRRRIHFLGIDEVVTAPASPWQNPFVERVIGSLRRELLEHVIILNERHLRRLLSSYLGYYHS
jgi:putative transposase